MLFDTMEIGDVLLERMTNGIVQVRVTDTTERYYRFIAVPGRTIAAADLARINADAAAVIAEWQTPERTAAYAAETASTESDG